MNKYDLDYIEKLRIHELRDFARKLGVGSPTTMKKDELIGKILSIVGDQAGVVTDSKIVKDSKEFDFFDLLYENNFSILNELLSDKASNTDSGDASDKQNNTVIIKKSYNYHDNNFQIGNNSFSFCLKQNELQFRDNDLFEVEGYLDIHPNGYGILRSNGFVPSENDSYISTSLVKKYKLKKGQYLSGKAKFVMVDKPKIVYEITEIDGNKDNKNELSFEDLDYNGIGNEYYLDKFNLKIRKGERHYIESLSIKEAVDFGFDLVDENNVCVKLINIKARPEDNYKSHQRLQVINVPFNKSEIEVVNAVELVCERIKRDFEQGKQNILIIYNFSELIRIFNVACEGSVDYDKINAKAVNKIYNILYMSKYLNENVCASVVCIDKNGVPRDITSLMELDIIPLFTQCHKNLERK